MITHEIHFKLKIVIFTFLSLCLLPIFGVSAQTQSPADLSGLFFLVALFPLLFIILVGIYSYYYWYIPRGILNKQKERMSTAIRLKYSTDPKKRLLAKNYFQKLDSEKLDADLTIIGKLYQADYFLADLCEMNTKENIEKLSKALDDLLTLVNKSRKIAVTPEIYVLQAKLGLVKKDLELAQKLYNKAEILIDERGLRSLKEVLLSSENFFSAKNYEEIKSLSTLDIIKKVNFENHLQRVIAEALQPIHGLPKEIPVWLISMLDSGLSLFSLNFLAESGLDDQMVGGFLTAINSFIKEALSGASSMDQLRYGEYNLLIQKMNKLNFCFVIRGTPENALKDLKQFSDNFKQHPQFTNRFKTDDMPSISAEDEKAFNDVVESTFFNYNEQLG